MKLSFERKLLLVFVIIIAGIAVAGVVAYRNNVSLQKTNSLVKHTQNVLYEAEQVLSITKDFGGSGYILTGDSNYLEHFNSAKAIIYSHINKLKELTNDDVAQQARIEFFLKLLDLRISSSQEIVEVRKQEGFEKARKLLATGKSKDYMDQIRRVIGDIEQSESDLLTQREQVNTATRMAFNRAFYSLLTTIAVMLVIIFIVTRRTLIRIKSAEELARAREAQIQTIFRAAPDAVVTIDQQGKITRWNLQAENIFGWKADEAMGKLLSETIIPHRYREAHTKGLKNFGETGEGTVLGKTIEIQALRKDNTEISVALSISPTMIEGKYIFIGFIQDITERKNAEEEVRRTTHFLDAILENIPNMIFVKDAKELRFVRFNKAGEELLGYSRKDLIGKNDYDFFPKEQADFFTKKDRGVLAKKMLADIAEEPIQTSHGERFLHTKKIPLMDDDGHPAYLLGISEYITEHKEAEERLRESNEQFLKLFYSNPTAMCINTVEEGRFIDVNESFEMLFGLKKTKLIGNTSIELGIINSEARTSVVSAVIKNGSARNVELTANNSKGKPVNVLLSVEKIKLKNSECLLSAMVDITERIKAEEKIHHLNEDLEKTVAKLQDLNTELESFTYSVSHDLRSPLRIIDGYADILYNDYNAVLNEDGKKTLGVIKSNARRMGQLIDDLLNLSRLGKRDLNFSKVDMNELVELVLKEQFALNPDQKVELKTSPLSSAHADSGTMRQVWTNYISNAFKYSRNKKKSLLEIGSYKEGKNNVYFVKDNGVGFDLKYADKLFGIFQRLHKVEEFEGTGVGLAIVQRIVARHGGKVWAEAKPDEGATFYFSLPA